jgi:hypothetical protein
VPDEYRRFAVIGVDSLAERDFVRNTFKVTLSDTGETVVDDPNVGVGVKHGHYGAGTLMAADILAHMKGDLPDRPLSVKDALEAGIPAIAMDIAREEGRVVDLAEIWAELDRAGRHAVGAVSQAGRSARWWPAASPSSRGARPSSASTGCRPIDGTALERRIGPAVLNAGD